MKLALGIILAALFAIGIIVTAIGIIVTTNRTTTGSGSVAEFKEHFARVGMAETMRETKLEGIENGIATISVRQLIPPTQKWRTFTVTAKLSDLDPALRAEVEKKAVEQFVK